MSAFIKEHCEACDKNATKVSKREITTLLTSLPHWKVERIDNIDQLSRSFTFKNFKLAMDFSNKIATLAEEEFHHPAILTEWGKVTIRWWSHSLQGLHKNDFIMASKTSDIFTSLS